MVKKVEKVCIIDPVGGHGGMDYYDYGLAMGLSANQIFVDYYTCKKTKERNYEFVSTYQVFKNVWEKKGLAKLYVFLMGYLKAFFFSKRNKSKVLHFHFFGLGPLNLLVLIMAYFFKQKKVVTLHDIESLHKQSPKLVNLLCLKFIDGIIFHNNFSKNEFEKKFKFRKQIAIIPHGNYLPFITSNNLKKTGNTINLLFFGQLKEVKGIDILLSAMKEVVKNSDKFHLTIAGRPWKTKAEHYSLKIKNMGLTNHVTTHFKYIEDEDVNQLFKEASIIIMPYKKIYQSGVLLLTLSYGRTVIASDLPPFKEVVSNGINGFLFESGNISSLSNCILKLTHTSILNVTKNSKSLISEKYDWVKIGADTLKFYKYL